MPTGCPVEHDFDPLAPEFLRDPFEILASLPDDEPVFYAPSLDYYVVTRHADIDAVFHDNETYSAATAQLPLVSLDPEAGRILLAGGHKPQPSMVSLDEPEHRRLRGPAARALTPRRVAAMEPTIRATLDELLDAIDPSEPVDLVGALTFPLPATVIFSFMGVPPEDYAQLRVWGGHRATLAWGRPSPDEQIEHATNMAAYRGYLRELVATKATERADDFASALLAIRDEDPESLSEEDIASILFSLSFAGHETTNYLIGNAVRRLLEDPDALADAGRRPVADPGGGRRDAALRPVGAGLAPRDHAAGHARRRRPARRREAVPVARGRGPRPRGLRRSGHVRHRARERPPPPRLRQGHPLLPGLRARESSRRSSRSPSSPAGSPGCASSPGRS